jgi:homoserine dehydrogenase
MRSLAIALLGFGTVGQAVAKALASGRHPGLRLALIFNRDVARKRVTWVPPEVIWTERIDEVFASPVDVVVELIGGREPARTWIASALERGKAVVTANKQVIAQWGPDLLALAARKSTALRFEAAVGGGIPILHALERGLAGDDLLGIAGIVNGTCNHVLTRIESDGLAFDAAVREAQALGYAEVDPGDDLDGADARAKLAILAMVGLGARVAPADVPAASIRRIEAVDFHLARRLGYTIRPLAWVERISDSPSALAAAVGPMLVPLESPFALTRGNQNLILVRGRASGETWFAGAGAGGDPTSVAVLSDLLAISRGERAGPLALHPVAGIAERETPHYLRLGGGAGGEAASGVAFLAARGLAATIVADAPPQVALLLQPCPAQALVAALSEFTAIHPALDWLSLPVFVPGDPCCPAPPNRRGWTGSATLSAS